MSLQKIGFHIIGNEFDTSLLDRAPLVVLVDPSLEYAQKVRAAMPPEGWLVIRRHIKDQNAYLQDPELGARRWYQENADMIRALAEPYIVFQGLNEIGNDQAHLLARFERVRLSLMQMVPNSGFGLGGWGVGQPREDLWYLFHSTIRAMDPLGDAILRHEYWGVPSDLANPWICGRWRLREDLEALTGRVQLITEIGRDVIWENGVRRGYAGWRKVPGLVPDAFLSEISIYGDLCDRYPLIRGAAPFSSGNTQYGWDAFDVNGLAWAIRKGHPERATGPTLPAIPPSPIKEVPHLPEYAPNLSITVIRWFLEEETRKRKEGDVKRANEIHDSLIRAAYMLEGRTPDD